MHMIFMLLYSVVLKRRTNDFIELLSISTVEMACSWSFSVILYTANCLFVSKQDKLDKILITHNKCVRLRPFVHFTHNPTIVMRLNCILI